MLTERVRVRVRALCGQALQDDHNVTTQSVPVHACVSLNDGQAAPPPIRFFVTARVLDFELPVHLMELQLFETASGVPRWLD